ncbi:MAG TPA: sulfurtransferase [Burkholderiales bacterium]|nr:sulfurtransferase [Burkholderiales bacterium]
MSGSTLVSTEALSRSLGAWRLFDCRHDLMKPELGEAQYRESHLPGAVFASLDRDLSAPKNGTNGRHPLPDAGAFVAWLGQQGLKPGDRVACYDGANGAMAARLWWMLRWVGHGDVAVLDGGFAKWMKEGHPVTSEIPRFAPTRYPARVRADAALDVHDVEKLHGKALLVDARAPARWRGESEPIDPVAGRIPGAKNHFNMDNVHPDGTFKTREELKRELRKVLGDRSPSELIHYCGSGVAACHNLLAMEHAGLPGGKLYAGSWSEWIADPRRPQERG